MNGQDGWYGKLRLRLKASRCFDDDEIRALVSEVEDRCGSARPALSLGPASEYAEGLIRSRAPVEVRARLGASDMSARDLLTVYGLLLGGVSIMHAVVLLLSGNWTLSISVNGIVGTAVVLLAAAVLGVAPLFRHSGMPRVGLACLPVVGLLVILAAWAFLRLPSEVVGQVWSVVPGAAGVVVGGACLGWFTRRRGDVPALAQGPDVPEKWFRRLRGLLVGRHHVPSARASELVGESRARFRESGSARPGDELGLLEVYALHLADGNQRRTPLLQRQEIINTGLTVLWAVIFLVDVVEGRPGWTTWMHLALVLAFAALASLAWWRASRRTDEQPGPAVS